MRILALETVTRAGSLAVYSSDGPGPAVLGDEARTHGVRLPGELLDFVRAAGFTLPDVDAFAVVTGPGSFTGLRIGLATIQGLALAGGRPAIGIPTLEAMAGGWIDASAGEATRLGVWLDAARGDVFYAAYDVDAGATLETARILLDPQVGKPQVAAAALAALPGRRPMVVTGSGADRFTSELMAAVPDARIATPAPNLAAGAARLAYRRIACAGSPHALRPLYVRRPDAELARERAAAPFTVVHVTSAADVAAVADLQARTFAEAWGAESFSGELANPDVARLYALKSHAGRIVAYCSGWQIVDELHINSLAVDPAFRRKGLARQLLLEVMRQSAADHVAAATLEVRQSNEAGRALYESLGFVVEGVRPGYYQNPREDALVLWRRGLG